MSDGFDLSLFRYAETRAREVPVHAATLYAAAQCVFCAIIAKAAIDEGEVRGVANAARCGDARDALDVVISLAEASVSHGRWEWATLAHKAVDSETDLRPARAAKAFARFCAECALRAEPIDAFAAFDAASRSWAGSAQFLGVPGRSVFGGDGYQTYVNVCVGLMCAASAGDRPALLEILAKFPVRELVAVLGETEESRRGETESDRR